MSTGAQNGGGIGYWMKEEISLTRTFLAVVLLSAVGLLIETLTYAYLVPEYLPRSWSIIAAGVLGGIWIGWTWRRVFEAGEWP